MVMTKAGVIESTLSTLSLLMRLKSSTPVPRDHQSRISRQACDCGLPANVRGMGEQRFRCISLNELKHFGLHRLLAFPEHMGYLTKAVKLNCLR